MTVPLDVCDSHRRQVSRERLGAVADQVRCFAHVVDVSDVPHHVPSRFYEACALGRDESKLSKVSTVVSAVLFVGSERIGLVVRHSHIGR